MGWGSCDFSLSLFAEGGVPLDLAPVLPVWEDLLDRSLSLVGPGWWGLKAGTYEHLLPIFVEAR